MNRIPSLNQEPWPDDVQALLLVIRKRYGYDFSGYAAASFHRRLAQFQQEEGVACLRDLIEPLRCDEQVFQRFLSRVTVSVTDMFRDPAFFASLRSKIMPRLRTYPFVKIWIAGCATGEEVYAIAITLLEEELLAHAYIYATDLNPSVLETARAGVYPLERLKRFTANYREAGGRAAFSDYFHAKYGRAIMAQTLKDRIVFGRHNLLQDAGLGEMHLILCRNVLIYFTRPLQDKVVTMFHQSLVYRGFLCLGQRENFYGAHLEPFFTQLGSDKIFCKHSGA